MMSTLTAEWLRIFTELVVATTVAMVVGTAVVAVGIIVFGPRFCFARISNTDLNRQ